MGPVQPFRDYSDCFSGGGFKAAISVHRLADKYRQGMVSLRERAAVAQMVGLPLNRLVYPIQIHSSRVKIGHSPGSIPAVDGVVTNRKDLVLSIQVADCIPLFLFDPRTHWIGLVHAGWRGIAGGIGRNAVAVLVAEGVEARDLVVLMGPSIRNCCYEVGPEVADQFASRYTQAGKGDRSYLDLQGSLTEQLLESGVEAGRILDRADCTCCSGERFYSYRREGPEAGRMIAICGWV